MVDKDWAAQHQQEFQDAQDKYRALVKAAGSAQVLKALIHGAGPGAAFALAFPVGATGGAALGTPIGAWAGGILGAPTGPGEVATIPAGTAIGAGIGYMLGGLAAGTLAAFAARKGLQALGQYSDAIKSLNASAELHPIADATGELATLAFNPVGAAEKAAGKGFSYALGAPAAVKSITNLTKLGAQAAKGAAEIGASGALAATKAVGGQLVKAAASGLIFEGAVRPAFEGAVWVAANTLGIHTDSPQPPTVTSLLQSAALSVLLAGHGLEFKEIPAGQVTSAMVRGKVRQDLGIPLDSTDPQHIAQVTSYLQSKGVPIDASNAKALTAPLSAGEQHLYTDLSAKVDAMRAAGKFDGKTGDFVPATQATVPGASGKGAVTLSGGVAAVDKPGGRGALLDSSPTPVLRGPHDSAAPGLSDPRDISETSQTLSGAKPIAPVGAAGLDKFEGAPSPEADSGATVKVAPSVRAAVDQPKGGNGHVLSDGAGATPEEIAASRGGATAGSRSGQPTVRAKLLIQAQAEENGTLTCWRCGAKSKNPADFHLGHRNVPTSAGGNLSKPNVALEGAACNLSTGNRGAPSAGMSCAERGGPGAPYGRRNEDQ